MCPALVEVAAYFDPFEAEIARGRLASEGVEAILFDTGLASLGLGAMTPARLMVADTDRRRAERLLGKPPG